jgi:hypothetical protein
MVVEYVEKKSQPPFHVLYNLICGIKVSTNRRELAHAFLDLIPGSQLLGVGVEASLSIPLLPTKHRNHHQVNGGQHSEDRSDGENRFYGSLEDCEVCESGVERGSVLTNAAYTPVSSSELVS